MAHAGKTFLGVKLLVALLKNVVQPGLSAGRGEQGQEQGQEAGQGQDGGRICQGREGWGKGQRSRQGRVRVDVLAVPGGAERGQGQAEQGSKDTTAPTLLMCTVHCLIFRSACSGGTRQ